MATADSRTGDSRTRVVVPTVYRSECPTIQSRILPLCRELSRHGFEFIIYVVGKESRNVEPGITYCGYGNYPGLVKRLLRLSRRDADLIYSCKPYTITGLLSLFVARLRSIGYVLDVDDMTFPSEINKWWRLPLYCQELLSEKLLMRLKVPTVVASAGLLDHWGHHATYIPNSVSLDLFKPGNGSSSEVRQRYGLNAPAVIWPAVFFQETDRCYILEIFSHIKLLGNGVYLLVVGDGEYLPRLQARASELGLDRVIFVGRVDYGDMPRWYASADAGILPLRNNRYDACKGPIKLFEYMAMELPVIATDIGEPAHILRTVDCGLILPFDEGRKAAEMIVALLNDNERLKRLGANGRAFLQEYQNHRLLAESLRSKFVEVMSVQKGESFSCQL